MRRKIFFVTLIFIITNVTNSCDNKSDEKCDFQVMSTSTDSSEAKETTISLSARGENLSEAPLKIYSSSDFATSTNSIAVEETTNYSAIEQNLSETTSQINSTSDISTSTDSTEMLEISTEDVTESTQQETETTSFQDLTTLPSTESTIHDTTPDETEPLNSMFLIFHHQFY